MKMHASFYIIIENQDFATSIYDPSSESVNLRCHKDMDSFSDFQPSPKQKSKSKLTFSLEPCLGTE